MKELDDTIIIRTEFICALDQDVSFTAKSWAKELELRAKISAEHDKYIASLGE